MRPLLILVALLASLPAGAQPWRYIDKQGVATYTTNPNDLPPAMRKKALAQLEQKRAEALARQAIEAEAAAAAPMSLGVAPLPDGTLPGVAPGAAPGSAAPGAAPGSAAPGSAAPGSEAPKPPTAREVWQKKVTEAGERVTTLTAELSAAQAAADEAHRRAIITPSGPNSARHAEAQERLQALTEQLTQAQGLLSRLERAAPRR